MPIEATKQMLEATQESLREHMAIAKELKEENELLKDRNSKLMIELQLMTNSFRDLASRVIKLEVRNG